MTLWRRRRRLLAAAQLIASLGLIYGFALLVWSVSDGPAVLSALGISTTLPVVKYSDAAIVPFFLGVCVGALRVYRLIYDLRARAILGDADAIPPASLLALADAVPLDAPITLVWRRTRRGRVGLMAGCCISLALYVGLGMLFASAGLFDSFSSLQGVAFWAAIIVLALGALGLALIPLAFLRAALRGPQGVVADSLGVRDWHGSTSIAWADARLLEVATGSNKGAGTLTYTLFAGDGSSLSWRSRSDDPRYTTAYRLIESDADGAEQRAAAILALAATHAGLTPRTFDRMWKGPSSKPALSGATHLDRPGSVGLWSANLTLLLGWTCGCGVATLLFHSPLTPALSLVCVASIAISTLWSQLLNIRDVLQMPLLLSPAMRSSLWSAKGVAGSSPAQLWQERNRLRNWPMATRAALLALGAAAGLVVIISALVTGPTDVDGFLAWMSMIWLALTLLFMGWRFVAQFERDRVRLFADAAGLRRLHAPSEPPTPWTDFASLRFTWSRADGFFYTATTRDNDEFTWASQSRLWRDEAPDATLADVAASAVDGDAFAAIVAARTGLAPAQELA